MERAAKAVVVVSTLFAAYVQLELAAPGWRPLFGFGLVAFAAALVGGLWFRTLAARLVLFGICVAPATLLVLTGRFHFTFEIVWMAALLGLILSGPGLWRWSVPAPWKWPIVAWALVVSVSWLIVLLRELDFAPWILGLPRVSNTSIGISPGAAATWMSYIVLGHNLGLLWLDWLFRTFPGRDLAPFRREVLVPISAGVLLACAVGAYQAFADIGFLSGHLWPDMNRAAGTFMDANVFGMMAALWAPAIVALAIPIRRSWSVPAGAAALGLAFVGVWTSGSRTALLALLVGLAAVAHHFWSSWREAAAQGRQHWLTTRSATVGLAVATVMVVLALGWSSGDTALARARHLVPGLGGTTVAQSLEALWTRDGYGTASVTMIREHPWIGTGVGMFHTLVHDYAAKGGHLGLNPDNAQNWYRHNLAELGFIGSLPWIGWCLLLLWALLQRTPEGPEGGVRRILRGPLLGIGIISLVGMPGQSPAIIVTFWTLAFWFLRVTETGRLKAAPTTEGGRAAHTMLAWAVVLLIVGVHAAGTYAAARGDLLPAHRAREIGWHYRYGISELEPDPDHRWTRKEAVAVLPVEGRVFRLEAWVDHPDADQQPVAARIWIDGRRIVDTELRRDSRIQLDVPVPDGEERIVLRTWVSRTWRPADHGWGDDREVGLALADWRWTR